MNGQKRAFQIFETCPILVQPRIKKILTIKVLLAKIKDNPLALSYLPDEPKTHVSQAYLYTIINTLDSAFFIDAEKEIEMKLPSRKKETAPEQISIDPQMLKLIEDFTSLRIHGSKARSIGGITKKRQKRTREQVTRDWEVIT